MAGKPRKKQSPDQASRSAEEPSANRIAMLLAAEKLFAEHGIQGVTLREINEAAGQRNASAVHYHFGSRDGIAEALIIHRMTPINSRRMEMLQILEKENRLSDTRAVIGCLIYPLAELIGSNDHGNYYVRFLERMGREPMLKGNKVVKRGWSQKIEELNLKGGWDAGEKHLRSLLSYLPQAIVSVRLQHLREQIVSGLASIEAWIGREDESIEDLEMMIENLIDGVVAATTSPVSARTLQALKGSKPKPSPRRK